MRALVAYSSKHGHTQAIADRIGEVLADAGHTVHVRDVGTLPRKFVIDDYDAVVLGSPVYAGKHMASLRRFVIERRAILQQRPSAFFSCSLTSAHRTDDARRTARDLVDAFIDETGWRPDHVGLFGGALLYRKYNFLVRFMMKHISRRAGGETDTSRDHDYTRWDEVDAFATELVQSLAAPSQAPSPESGAPRA